ncbi:MAG: ATP-dependent DNA helicase RecQ [Actinobacteria bacterium]|nr:MAG: ATP-dependent DNA helicase RecQ [Actinomycetota bacterium]
MQLAVPELHPAQRESLDALAAGEDVLTVMATGRGKSLIFHLHAARTALVEGRASVFVYPLRALVSDQAFHLVGAFAALGLAVATVTGESSATARDEAFAGLTDGAVHVILTTPEFLCHHAARFAGTGRVGFVVVDEAHHVGMARAGHRPAYARLGEALDTLGRPRVLAVTATASDEVAAAIRDALGVSRVVCDPTVRDNLGLADRRGSLASAKEKDAYLVKLAAEGGKAIVYVNSRDQSVRVARALRDRVPGLRHRAAFYNGGLSRPARLAVERAFRAGEIDVVVATSAFGEGVNIPDVRHVALYHLPFNDVEFNQMCGRAGRDGASASVHLLFGEPDGRINDLILEAGAPERDDLAALYLVLKDAHAAAGEAFEATNAELAERVKARRPKTRLSERGVSAGIGVFRELGLVTGEGYGAYRRLAVVPEAERVDLGSSVRYAEGRDEIEQFAEFRTWVLTASADVLLARFNRPILPGRSGG